MSTINRQIVLASRPKGEVTPDNFRLVETPLAPLADVAETAAAWAVERSEELVPGGWETWCVADPAGPVAVWLRRRDRPVCHSCGTIAPSCAWTDATTDRHRASAASPWRTR